MNQHPATISASRVPAVLGLDHRKSPLMLYLELTGKVTERDISSDPAVQEGLFYERATADIVCAKHHMEIVEGFEQMDMASGNLSGHPDFVVLDENRQVAPLEVKNPFWSYVGASGDDDWGEPETDQVPRAHYIQVLVYQELLRAWDRENPGKLPGKIAPHGYVCAKLRGGVERYRVPYDADIVAKIRQEVDAMLFRAERGVPPDPQDERDARLRWSCEDPEKVSECAADMLAVVRQLEQVKQRIREMEQQESSLKHQILAYMQDAAVLEYVGDHGERVRLATAKPNRVFDAAACWEQHRDRIGDCVTLDKARLRKEHPALYQQFMRVPEGGQTRTIRINTKALEGLEEA